MRFPEVVAALAEVLEMHLPSAVAPINRPGFSKRSEFYSSRLIDGDIGEEHHLGFVQSADLAKLEALERTARDLSSVLSQTVATDFP